MTAPGVRLERADERDKPVLWDLLTAYLIEHTQRVEPGRQYQPGGYPYFDSYWSEPEGRAYWIMRDGQRAGFALVNSYSPSGRGVDRSIAEFCVLPGHRRGGAGLAAAVAVLRAQPGLWEVQVYRANPDGAPF